MKTKIRISLAAILIAIAGNAFAATHTVKPAQPLADSLFIKPFFTGKKNVIRLFPNPTFDGSININAHTDNELHFYIFDVDGVLLYRTTLKGDEKKNIPDLRKGVYTYDVFENDESIEQGSIIVK